MQAALPPKAPHRLRRFFLSGFLFEVFIIIFGNLLPESWLQIEVGNFVTVTHYPLLKVLSRCEDGLSAILCLLIGAVFMASVWGFLIYLLTGFVKGLRSHFIVSPLQKLVWRWGLVILGITVLSGAIIATLPATPIAFTASPEVRATVESNTAFALDLYQKLKEQPGNLFFSPYSISTSLAMTYAGARGQTESEMAKALHFNPTQTNLPMAFSELAVRMNRVQRWNRITLLTANSLWCQQDYHFMEAYLKLVHKFYHAEARPVDFIHSASTAARGINAWVERQTKGRIHGAVQPSQFNNLTRLVLCDAIYFKGKWQHPFKVSDTTPAPFHVSTNETVTVPMMYQKAHFKAIDSENDPVDLLELPYSGTDLSMIILLPRTGYPPPDVENPGLPDLEQRLTIGNLRTWLAELDQSDSHEISVELPRFTTSQSFDLVEELKSLGMKSAFEENTANFSGIDGTTNLHVSDVIHKAFVEVSESGTEAAAINVQLAQTMGMALHFDVDHPFIFLIRDNGSGSILFIGRIVDPRK